MRLDTLRWVAGPLVYLVVWSLFVVVALVQLGRLPVDAAPSAGPPAAPIVCASEPHPNACPRAGQLRPIPKGRRENARTRQS